MELIDVVDENNKLTGRVEDRKTVQEESLWHRIVSCWILNNNGEVLLQKRAATKEKKPNIWGKTGGHVDSGEIPDEAIKREVKEELGIDVPEDQVILVDIFKSRGQINKYFGYNYIFVIDNKIDEFTLQKEEVDQVKYYTIEELEELKRNKNQNYVFWNWPDEDFFLEMKKLKNIRKDLKNNK